MPTISLTLPSTWTATLDTASGSVTLDLEGSPTSPYTAHLGDPLQAGVAVALLDALSAFAHRLAVEHPGLVPNLVPGWEAQLEQLRRAPWCRPPRSHAPATTPPVIDPTAIVDCDGED